jgi:hypothetical protein
MLERRTLMALSTTTWTAIGPQPIVSPDVGPLSGRLTVAVADPSNPNVMYVAGDSGFDYGDGSGIWKTTDWLDPDPTWVPVVPPDLAQDIAIHGLAMAPTDPNTLYAASNGPEGGILKTTDGGATWQLLDSTLFAQSSFGAIAVSPLDPNVVFLGVYTRTHEVPVPNLVRLTGDVTQGSFLLTNLASASVLSPGMPVVGPGIPANTFVIGVNSASQVTLSQPATASTSAASIAFQTDGLWESVDGGQTFVNITPRNVFPATAGVPDLAISPGDPSTLWVGVTGTGPATDGVWRVHLPPYPSADSTGWVSQMKRNGAITAAVGDYIQLAIAPSDAGTIYATIFLPSTTPGILTRWMTGDSGSSWFELPEPTVGNDDRAFHTLLAVSPTDPTQVFINGAEGPGSLEYLGVTTTEQGTGSVTWIEIPTGGEDVDEASFDATGAFVLDTDRGVLRSVDPTAAIPQFEAKRGTLNNALFYDIAMDPTNPNVVYGVMQDQLLDAKTTDTLPAWQFMPVGAEVGRILVDPSNPQVVYNFGSAVQSGPPTSPLGNVNRSDDGGMFWYDDSNRFKPGLLNLDPLGSEYNQPLQPDVQAFAIDPYDTALLAAGGYAVQELNSSGKWSQISPMLATTGQPGYVESLAFAPNGLIYAGTNNGLLWVSPTNSNANNPWQQLTLPDGATGDIRDIVVNPADSSDVFLVVQDTPNSTNFSAADRVLELTKSGQTQTWTWREIGAGIPDGLSAFSLAVDWRATTPVLYVGTDRGVYEST